MDQAMFRTLLYRVGYTIAGLAVVELVLRNRAK